VAWKRQRPSRGTLHDDDDDDEISSSSGSSSLVMSVIYKLLLPVIVSKCVMLQKRLFKSVVFVGYTS